jgi:CBS-domain-containing membrane protein
MIRVQQLMSHQVYVCRPDDSLERAARLMWDHDIGAVVVVDDACRAMAMLTDRDACMAAFMAGRPLFAIPVQQAMSKGVYTVRGEEPVDQAQLVMREHQVRRLPVTDADGRLIGLLSQNDLLYEAARERSREIRGRELSPAEITTTLASIGRSRAGELAPAAPPAAWSGAA